MRQPPPQSPTPGNHGEAFDGLFNSGGGVAYACPTGPRKPAPATGSRDNPHRPATRAEARALPSGAHFVDPAGVLRVRH